MGLLGAFPGKVEGHSPRRKTSVTVTAAAVGDREDGEGHESDRSQCPVLRGTGGDCGWRWPVLCCLSGQKGSKAPTTLY